MARVRAARSMTLRERGSAIGGVRGAACVAVPSTDSVAANSPLRKRRVGSGGARVNGQWALPLRVRLTGFAGWAQAASGRSRTYQDLATALDAPPPETPTLLSSVLCPLTPDS
ncbi:MAG: hypothetical protein AMXMBFR42_23280 [Burkholderiales bacterium]